MRVLWFSGNSSLYKSDHQNGGWIGALQNYLLKSNDIYLGVAFPTTNKNDKIKEDDKLKYYPVYTNSLLASFLNKISLHKRDDLILKKYYNVIADFRPDIIHIWGTELEYGLVVEETKVPIIIHIQGLINPIYYSKYPNGLSAYSFG